MLPWHFQIIEKVLKLDGFDIEILHNESKEVINEGLKHVHNDTCYPCLCVVGQYINALKSGKYDLDKRRFSSRRRAEAAAPRITFR